MNDLDDTERQCLDDGLKFTEYAQNKYIVLGDLRRQQKMWYDFLKKLNDKDFVDGCMAKAGNLSPDELRREIYNYYLEAKTKREKLQKELDSLNIS